MNCCFIVSVRRADLYWFTCLQYSSLSTFKRDVRPAFEALFFWKMAEGLLPSCCKSVCKLQTSNVFSCLILRGFW